MNWIGEKPQEPCLGYIKIAGSMGEVSEGVMKALEFKSEV